MTVLRVRFPGREKKEEQSREKSIAGELRRVGEGGGGGRLSGSYDRTGEKKKKEKKKNQAKSEEQRRSLLDI